MNSENRNKRGWHIAQRGGGGCIDHRPLINSKASFGLSTPFSVTACKGSQLRDPPVYRLDWDLLVDELPAFLEDEVAALRLAAFPGPEGTYEEPLGVGN